MSTSDKYNFSNPPCTLDVTVYGATEQITDTLSKSRVRIFYKGMNRNRTFISEDFADQLIASLPYTPVKGIFDKDSLDFEDHGEDNADGRIYGIVPENPNFAWEEYTDIDGITRLYACCDVYLFTGLYPEASLVPGKSQSMEIFRKTLKGEWRLSEEDRKPYYHFISGSLVGLQALGDDIEPCFEGSMFFTALKDLETMANYLKNFMKKEESKRMDKTLFRISDNEKAEILFELINPNFNEENNWELTGIITDVYDDYALYVNKDGYYRAYYSKDDDNIILGDIIPVKIIDVTESEYTALEAMKAIGGTYTSVQIAYENATEKISELEAAVLESDTNRAAFEKKVSELEAATSEFEAIKTSLEGTIADKDIIIADFNSKIESYEAEKVELNNKISDITNENNQLLEFKKNVEITQKEAILTKYEEHLTEEAITEFKKSIEILSVEDFKKEVCTSAVENDSSIFSNRDSEPAKFYKGDNASGKTATGGILALLEKRKNGGNK